MNRGFTYAAYALLAIVAMALVLSRCACGGGTTSCETVADCAAGEVCVGTICIKGSVLDAAIPPFDQQTIGCSTDEQCGPCEFCDEGFCKNDTGCDAGAVEWPDGSVIIIDAGDAGKVDAGDAGDTGTADAGDAGDTGTTDAGDTGTADAGDTGTTDAGDAGDAGAPDAGDAGSGDAGSCDAGSLPPLTISGVVPATGKLPRGKQITINGQGFDTVCSSNEILFQGDTNPAPLISVTATQLKVRIPRNANTGIITIKAAGRQDTSQSVTIVRRAFLTREGSVATPGQTFSLLNLESMQAFASGTYQVGQSAQAAKMPTAVVLNPKQWKIYFISADPADEAHVISIHDYADLTYLSTIGVTGGGPGYAALWDEDRDRLLVTHQGGMLSVIDTLTDTAAASSPFTFGTRARGLDLDKTHNRYYIGTGDAGGNGAVTIVGYDLQAAGTIPLGAGGDPADVKYDAENDLILVADATAGTVRVFNAGTLAELAASPIDLGAGAAPMSIALGGTGASRRAFVACTNNASHSQASPHATLAAIDLPALTAAPSSPADVGILTTSDDNLGDFDQVRAVYDRRDDWVFVTSDYDKLFGVLKPDLSKVTLAPNVSPFQSPSSKGNLGIAVEDW